MQEEVYVLSAENEKVAIYSCPENHVLHVNKQNPYYKSLLDKNIFNWNDFIKYLKQS